MLVHDQDKMIGYFMEYHLHDYVCHSHGNMYKQVFVPGAPGLPYIYPMSRVVHRHNFNTLASIQWTQKCPQESQGQGHCFKVEGQLHDAC